MSVAGADPRSFAPRAWPGTEPLDGRFVRVEPIVDDRRFEELYEAFAADRSGGIFDYMAYGPFADRAAFDSFARDIYLSGDMRFHALVPVATGKASGVAALMRADRGNGVIEIGHICLALSLQRTAAASEALFLIMDRALGELGYRRLEWKCDERNLPSRRAAERLGFRYEGTFRQHMIVKRRNRDTAWFSIIDREWQALKHGFEAWLSHENIDADGRQRRRLEEMRAPPAEDG